MTAREISRERVMEIREDNARWLGFVKVSPPLNWDAERIAANIAEHEETVAICDLALDGLRLRESVLGYVYKNGLAIVKEGGGMTFPKRLHGKRVHIVPADGG